MHSLKDKFDDLRHRLAHDRSLESAGSEPVFYLVFPVSEILEVKRQTKAWIAKLSNEGWRIATLSMVDAVASVLQNNKLRKFWLKAEKQKLEDATAANQPIDFRETVTTLEKALTEGPELMAIVEEKLAEAASAPDGLLLLTDLEALHPYLRINSIEAKLQNNVRCPVVVLYPGKREGKTSLRFLEFYPADPNYRSEHIG
jgi:hypothetical protein